MPYDKIEEITIDTFSDLVYEVETRKKPFIVRNFHLINLDWVQFSNSLNQEPEVFGYYETTKWDTIYSNGNEVLDLFLKEELKMNIVDAPVTVNNFLSPEWSKYADQKLGENSNYSATYILTNKNKLTLYHTDPPYAGGYMYLKEGYKTWYCINPDDWNHIQSHSISRDDLINLSDDDIERLSNNYLTNKICKNYLSSNDFIWFPIDTLHKVTTEKNSWGIGGYL